MVEFISNVYDCVFFKELPLFSRHVRWKKDVIVTLTLLSTVEAKVTDWHSAPSVEVTTQLVQGTTQYRSILN